MNRDLLYDFTTSILDGFEMDLTLFYTFLDVAQSNREGYRPWVILRTIDATQTAAVGNSFLTAKTLPIDFKKTYNRFPIVLTDSQGNVVRKLRQIPISEKNQYKDDAGKFYINFTTGQYFICGAQSQSCTINLSYIKRTTKVSSAASNTWAFDTYDDAFSKVLGLDVAVMHKLGVDYDQINAVQADANARLAQMIINGMAEWDSELAQNAQEGIDMGTNSNTGFQELSGRVSELT